MKKKQKRKYVGLKSRLLIFLLSFSITTIAQQVGISGNVTDEKGEALIGVSVIVKGAKQGTITDIYGNFNIQASNDDATLVFSYLGFSQKEIKTKGQKKLQVILLEDSQSLDEVVVIGYGEVKRQDLTGAVGTVKTADIQKAPVRSFEEALGGRIAGVQVTSSEGTPGAGMNVVIRGKNSITQENSPLYVIDGFPMENFDSNTLNPSDVESIDILKDASATAIYGALGANGVIMVTTRRGKEGRPQVVFDAYYGWQKVNKTMDMMDAYEFVRLQKDIDAYQADGMYLERDPATGEPTKTPESYKGKPSLSWQDQVLQSAPIQNYTLSLSSGSKTTKYSLSLNYFNQEGVIIKSGFDRYQGRLRLDQEVNKKLKFGLNMNYSQTKQYGTSVRFDGGSTEPSLGLMYNVWGYRPVNGSGNLNELLEEPEDLEISGLGSYGNRYNPLQYIKNELRETYQTNTFFNMFMEYQFSKFLKLRVSGGMNTSNLRRDMFFNSKHPNAQKIGGIVKGVNGSQRFDETQSLLNENSLTYSRTFNKKHSIYVTAGLSMQKYTRKVFGGEAWEIPRESLGVSGLDEGKAQPLVALRSENALVSYLARFNYNYKAKYYATMSFRADGSSKFPKDNRWGYFTSGSLAWRVSKEKFLQDITTISDAKVRAGYGSTGNNRVSDFGYLSALDLNNLLGYSQNNSFGQGAAIGNLGNNKLKWERTNAWNAGIDLGLFDQRVTFTADWYLKKTKDLLLNTNLPPSSGFSKSFMNIGSVQNSGVELTLGTINIDNRNFTWTSNFNISWNRNKVLALADGENEMLSNMTWNANYSTVPLYTAQVGKPIAQFIGYKWVGNYQISDFNWQNNNDPNIPHEQRTYILKDDVPDNGLARNQIKPGHIKYKDIPDENGQTDGHIDNNDRVVIGDPNPDFEGGFTNNFTYKGFDLNVFLQFSVGNDIINANRLMFEGTYRYGLNQYASYANRWTPETPDASNHAALGHGNSYYSTRIVEDGSFLRLKTVQIGYTFPTKWIRPVGMSKLRLYFSAQNLYTWTKYSGWDPEVSINSSALTPGFDYAPYPRSQTFVFGVNATF